MSEFSVGTADAIDVACKAQHACKSAILNSPVRLHLQSLDSGMTGTHLSLKVLKPGAHAFVDYVDRAAGLFSAAREGFGSGDARN